MTKIVFLLEEPSMKVFLDVLLPRLFPGLSFQCVQHEGKRDLELSVPRKLRAWREPGVRFVILRDNDGGDCMALKSRLLELCEEGRRPDTLVRIACQELEAWYLGEPEALGEVYGDKVSGAISGKARFRDPDRVVQPAAALAKLVPEFQKVSGARRLAAHLTREGNHSSSFKALLSGILRLREEGA